MTRIEGLEIAVDDELCSLLLAADKKKGGKSKLIALVELNDILALAGKRQIPISEATIPELDRLAGEGVTHQGVILTVSDTRCVC